jgi:peptidoglycan/LPS O-acetylase OafA/YrhL
MMLQAALRAPQGQNLTHLRLLAALAVIISHAWPLAYGRGTAEPLAGLTGHSLGGWAVGLFFFLSGMLIYTSAARRSAGSFAMARARRILPGLAAALIVTLALAMASGSTASLSEAARYMLRGITMLSLEHSLSNAYAANPYPMAVNGPLWSLAHEIMAYVLCLMLVKSGLLRSVWGLALLLGASVALWAVSPHLPAQLENFAPLWLAFALGMGAARLAARLPLSPLWAIALALLAPLGWPFAIAALGYGALVLALRLPPLPQMGDISFGLYIYGWPVAQMAVHLWPGLDAPSLALLSVLASLPFAIASWRWVEKPSLAQPAAPRMAAA